MSIPGVMVTNFEQTARHRMIFHRLRLRRALKAFQKDTWAGRQQWWIQNLKFELVWTQVLTCRHPLTIYQNNALTFLGLCTTQDCNVPVPNLIRLLAQTLPRKTGSCVLSTSQIWEEVYSFDELDLLTNQLYLAWWADPNSQGCFTSDELDEAFEQYLLRVRHD